MIFTSLISKGSRTGILYFRSPEKLDTHTHTHCMPLNVYSNPGVHKFAQNLGAISKFYAPGW
jgi:hypothetical protein